MIWTVEYAASVRKSARRLSSEVRKRIRMFIEDRLASLDDPRQLGTPLRGARFEDLWRFRVGDYRIIVRIEHARLTILVLAIGHRRDGADRVPPGVGGIPGADSPPSAPVAPGSDGTQRSS